MHALELYATLACTSDALNSIYEGIASILKLGILLVILNTIIITIFKLPLYSFLPTVLLLPYLIILGCFIYIRGMANILLIILGLSVEGKNISIIAWFSTTRAFTCRHRDVWDLQKVWIETLETLSTWWVVHVILSGTFCFLQRVLNFTIIFSATSAADYRWVLDGYRFESLDCSLKIWPLNAKYVSTRRRLLRLLLLFEISAHFRWLVGRSERTLMEFNSSLLVHHLMSWSRKILMVAICRLLICGRLQMLSCWLNYHLYCLMREVRFVWGDIYISGDNFF